MKAMIVIDIPNIIEPCAIDELGFVADLHIQPTTLCDYDPFDLKDVDVRPLPSRKYNDESVMAGSLEMDIGYILGWNTCIEELEKKWNT